MRKFEENQPLMRYIEENSVENIKGELKNIIFFVSGDIEEAHRAVEYAIANSDFDYEEHEQLPVFDSDLSTEYASVGLNLEKNFSKQRFEKLLDLYQRLYGNKEATVVETIEVETPIDESITDEENISTSVIEIEEDINPITSEQNDDVMHPIEEDILEEEQLVSSNTTDGNILTSESIDKTIDNEDCINDDAETVEFVDVNDSKIEMSEPSEENNENTESIDEVKEKIQQTKRVINNNKNSQENGIKRSKNVLLDLIHKILEKVEKILEQIKKM